MIHTYNVEFKNLAIVSTLESDTITNDKMKFQYISPFNNYI